MVVGMSGSVATVALLVLVASAGCGPSPAANGMLPCDEDGSRSTCPSRFMCVDGLCVAGKGAACGGAPESVTAMLPAPTAKAPTGTIDEIDLPTPCASPIAIATATDGAIWFVEFGAQKIGRVSQPDGTLTEMPIPAGQFFDVPDPSQVPPSGPTDITAGVNGEVWYWELEGAGPIGHVTSEGKFSESWIFNYEGPAHLALGPTGLLGLAIMGQLGLVDSSAPSGGGSEQGLPISDTSSARGIVVDAQGRFWFTETPNLIVRFEFRGSEALFELGVGDVSPHGLALAPDGAVWFTETSRGRIGRLSSTGAVDEFPLPASDAMPTGIVVGPDGNLWFTETGDGKIGRITMAGIVTEFPLASRDAAPTGIAAAPDGNLWFVETGANRVGRIAP